MKGIPEFWLTALKTNQETDQLLIGEKDDDALKHLVDIKSAYLDDNPVECRIKYIIPVFDVQGYCGYFIRMLPSL